MAESAPTIHCELGRITMLRCSPTPLITLITCVPGRGGTSCLRLVPVPAGVPVVIRSPGSRVTELLTCAMTVATSKISSEVFALCVTRPSTRQ